MSSFRRMTWAFSRPTSSHTGDDLLRLASFQCYFRCSDSHLQVTAITDIRWARISVILSTLAWFAVVRGCQSILFIWESAEFVSQLQNRFCGELQLCSPWLMTDFILLMFWVFSQHWWCLGYVKVPRILRACHYLSSICYVVWHLAKRIRIKNWVWMIYV